MRGTVYELRIIFWQHVLKFVSKYLPDDLFLALRDQVSKQSQYVDFYFSSNNLIG